VAAPRLYLNRIAEFDWLIALEFGRVDDGQPPENWRGVSDTFGFLHESPGGPEIGFKIVGFSEFDTDDPKVAEIWRRPRFDVPVLGLREVSAGEVVLAARALFGERSSINRQLFTAAIDAEGDEALRRWLACLQSGDAMAHYGLGYTLYGLGRFHEAYRHLRHYTEIAPCGSWSWCWLGRAAQAVGETSEARAAYERALELERAGGEETDARELLEALGEGGSARRGTAPPGTRRMTYWDYDPEARLICPQCGWTGRGGDHERRFTELLDVRCPRCERMLLIVSHPTIGETRAAAAAGNRRAQADLADVGRREAYLTRAEGLQLTDPNQLPDLPGDRIVIDWDFEKRDGECWTVLRHDGIEILREPACYEGHRRFAAVFELLRKRYGSRLAAVRPTPSSKMYLNGDTLSAPGTIDRLNASLDDE
jgi:tetratricopeptide (TPR) repeat protein